MKFGVDKKRQVRNVGWVKSVHPSLDYAIISMVKSSPKWKQEKTKRHSSKCTI